MYFSILHDFCICVQKNIYVADLTEELVTSPAQALAWIRKGESKIWDYRTSEWWRALQTVCNYQCVFSSVENRHYGKTKMNQRSSRSHTIFRMVSNTTSSLHSDISDSGESWIFHNIVLLDPGKSRKKRPSIRRKCRWSHYCVSFGKLAPFIGLLSIFILHLLSVLSVSLLVLL